jgi:hypothetical protein
MIYPHTKLRTRSSNSSLLIVVMLGGKENVRMAALSSFLSPQKNYTTIVA